ncbi:uncharacterized protein EHS24_002233 [Apiotrichum porosum]|uniref:BRCT domain-containing protein n=1 Tax=Apiotrichum porosum TaxID=105984 RepID=A0A427XI33_9TREE|nr:uncharacterized protein EHS24_002233 [Apiotrichum porosum]RSH78508.1 hypothetical protein EHS24_002233 [Apiotrichum porosum]
MPDSPPPRTPASIRAARKQSKALVKGRAVRAAMYPPEENVVKEAANQTPPSSSEVEAALAPSHQSRAAPLEPAAYEEDDQDSVGPLGHHEWDLLSEVDEPRANTPVAGPSRPNGGADQPAADAIDQSLPPSPRGVAAAAAADIQVQEAGADSNREASAAPSADPEVDLPVRPLRRGPCPGEGPPPAQKKYPHHQIFCGDRDTAVSLAFVGVHSSIVDMARKAGARVVPLADRPHFVVVRVDKDGFAEAPAKVRKLLREAQWRGTTAVSTRWLHDCVDSGHVVAYRKYHVKLRQF